jgi:hypothetical protein
VAEPTIHARIDAERKAASPRPQDLRDFRKYARGIQRGTLTPEQMNILRGVTGHLFSDNVCAMVINAAASRMQLTRFDVSVQSVLDYLHGFWVLGGIPEFSAQVHFAALRDGNHAVSLAWEGDASGRVRLAREPWWDGKSGIFVAYDALNQPAYAVKEWLEVNGVRRRTVYRPDRIERYVLKDQGWQPFRLPGDTLWPAPWVDKSGNPIGIPIVHFRDTHIPADDSDNAVLALYGTSELDGGVLGIQDEINSARHHRGSALYRLPDVLCNRLHARNRWRQARFATRWARRVMVEQGCRHFRHLAGRRYEPA